MKSKKVSVVIVQYKVKDLLFKCIGSIYASKPKVNFEIIVVDNDEKPVIGNDLKKKFPKVKYVANGKNLGFGAGNNLGVRNAEGEYLFFLNPDTQLQGNTLDELYKFLKENPKTGIVSPLILDKDKKPLDRQGYKELNLVRGIFTFTFLRKKFPKFGFSTYYSLEDWSREPVKKVQTVYGAAMMLPLKLFNKLGGFDESFFLYFEENDLSARVRKLGYELFIDSKAKIVHSVGQSTKQLATRDEYFAKSRFLYYKKHYGILQALLLEYILKIKKSTLFITVVLALTFLLRIYNLSQSMEFIGDQGWFYISARNLLIYHQIPLVGITSSHIWLHQGPLWTYILAAGMLMFNFNPVSGAYITAFFGVLTVYLIYKLGTELFSKRVGIASSVLYCVSPLIVSTDRMPFDPSPIPFFSLLFLYALYKWVSGNIKYFPWIIFLIAVLYNLELATFTLFFPFALLFIYGFWKKKQFVLSLKNSKTIIYSAAGLLIPMLPLIVYDFSHGFKQTIVFLGWTFYKPFSFMIKHPTDNFAHNIWLVSSFLVLNVQKLVFGYNGPLAVLFFLGGLATVLYLWKRDENYSLIKPKFLLLFLLIFLLLGILINQTPSDAYLPTIFPYVILTVGMFFDFLYVKKRTKYLALGIFFIVVLTNIYYSFKITSGSDLKNRTIAVEKIIKLINGKQYNLVGKGQGSQFISFTMNYEYLLWYKGYAPSSNPQKLKITVQENNGKIIVEKKYD